MNKKITIITCITEHFLQYIKLLKKSGELLKSGNNEINWYCMLSGEDFDDTAGFIKLGITPHEAHAGRSRHSYNHGLALNNCLNLLPDSDITIIMDADVIITLKDWDEIVCEELENNQIFGVSFNERSKKYKNFPTIFFFAMDTNLLKKINIDFTPKIKIKNSSYNKIYWNSEQVILDTGWRMISLNNLKYSIMKNITLPSSKCITELKCDFYDRKMNIHTAEEWHYNGQLFASHKTAGRSRSLDQTRSKLWFVRINNYLLKVYNITL